MQMPRKLSYENIHNEMLFILSFILSNKYKIYKKNTNATWWQVKIPFFSAKLAFKYPKSKLLFLKHDSKNIYSHFKFLIEK
jgi:hypothetical protein